MGLLCLFGLGVVLFVEAATSSGSRYVCFVVYFHHFVFSFGGFAPREWVAFGVIIVLAAFGACLLNMSLFSTGVARHGLSLI
jgi:hypothetical protein